MFTIFFLFNYYSLFILLNYIDENPCYFYDKFKKIKWKEYKKRTL